MLKMLNHLKLLFFKLKFKHSNKNNHTSPSNIFDLNSVNVGLGSYGYINLVQHGINTHLNIGNYVSIADDVTFVLSGEHRIETISSYPYRVYVCGDQFESFGKGAIIVDDDVWIGYRATILSGVHIGQGAVIAAGAVVSHDVPPYAIVGGVPAKVIKYRFSESVINVLMTIDYSKLTKGMITDYIDDLYKPLDGLTAAQVEEAIAWMPKKYSKTK